MARISNGSPPTAKQVEAFQLAVIHRGTWYASKATGQNYSVLKKAVHGFLKRTRWDGPR